MVLVPAELRRVAHPLAHQGRQEGRRQHIAGAQAQGPFRRLGTARTLLDNRRTSSELQKLCNLSDYPARKTMEAARGFSAPFCKRAAELILETDYRLKTSYDDSQRLLELLVLELAREASHG